LWACLDALVRHTRTPARFVLVDNWHPDRQVDAVIDAFRKRGLLEEVHRFETNTVDNIRSVYEALLPTAGAEHVYLESDVCVQPPPGQCWLGEMLRIHRADPQIGMLGSLVDTGDFVDESVYQAMRQRDGADPRFLAKMDSPERGFMTDPAWAQQGRDSFPVEPPCPITNPPGRLLMLQTSAMRDIGLVPDADIALAYRLRGYRPAVTARVQHRHLSLLNIFDYDDYSGTDRDRFFEAMRQSRSPRQVQAP
jgi:GT2 family glycosyltransferase